MQPLIRLAARISRDLSLALHRATYSSATVRRQWPLAAQAWRQVVGLGRLKLWDVLSGLFGDLTRRGSGGAFLAS
jgi:hypothetical protein